MTPTNLIAFSVSTKTPKPYFVGITHLRSTVVGIAPNSPVDICFFLAVVEVELYLVVHIASCCSTAPHAPTSPRRRLVSCLPRQTLVKAALVISVGITSLLAVLCRSASIDTSGCPAAWSVRSMVVVALLLIRTAIPPYSTASPTATLSCHRSLLSRPWHTSVNPFLVILKYAFPSPVRSRRLPADIPRPRAAMESCANLQPDQGKISTK
ncbi:hypothetical protein KC19_VG187200 [Ceratodon purpureus]|uniref:Uncharacterized protein n=1 Tax=Ceratodon purpureus TaxID=3225 RepID=A0A8T0HRX6_CERPU|nr:hypothetical protein KC19_VG187200 [Ceratodon purpureus]